MFCTPLRVSDLCGRVLLVKEALMKVIALVISFVLFLGGLALMGYATTFSTAQGVVFIGGILCVALSFGLPIHWMHKFD